MSVTYPTFPEIRAVTGSGCAAAVFSLCVLLRSSGQFLPRSANFGFAVGFVVLRRQPAFCPAPPRCPSGLSGDLPGVSTPSLRATSGRLSHSVRFVPLGSRTQLRGRRHRRISNPQPTGNLEPTKKLPECYQMLPSFGSISKLRVATTTGRNRKTRSGKGRKTCKKLPNATNGAARPGQLRVDG